MGFRFYLATSDGIVEGTDDVNLAAKYIETGQYIVVDTFDTNIPEHISMNDDEDEEENSDE